MLTDTEYAAALAQSIQERQEWESDPVAQEGFREWQESTRDEEAEDLAYLAWQEEMAEVAYLEMLEAERLQAVISSDPIREDEIPF